MSKGLLRCITPVLLARPLASSSSSFSHSFAFRTLAISLTPLSSPVVTSSHAGSLLLWTIRTKVTQSNGGASAGGSAICFNVTSMSPSLGYAVGPSNPSCFSVTFVARLSGMAYRRWERIYPSRKAGPATPNVGEKAQ